MCLALPGRVVALGAEDALRLGTVDFGGVRREVCLELVPDAALGDWVLVHVGFALRRVDERAAAEALAALGAGPAPAAEAAAGTSRAETRAR